ncbi:hypothetical protein FOZ61_004334 [Perkinsus olseni]|uniref:Uncharacterized protein n=1 Tax=Perkinsus olseni TaxID=32597 RepID=A0A7J6M098_PEROL|nr:hypothetical protein FOZ61_004334 [Perkinsus olseni]KAF4664630.1 hypothetical protein FOL46_004117 [Perkinsus olseni]
MAAVSAKGELFVYNQEDNLTLFEFDGEGHDEPSSTGLLFMAGLTDGFLRPFYPALLAKRGLRVFQVLMHSSYSGYGYSSLDSDVEDMTQALAFLKEHHGVEHVFLLGHSTGCQDVVHFIKTRTPEEPSLPTVEGCILQGAVSDRDAVDFAVKDCQKDQERLHEMRELAASLLEREPLCFMPPEASEFTSGHPIHASRFASLFCRMSGPDDMFSRDLSDTELLDAVGHMTEVPRVLLVQGLNDEYVDHSLPNNNNSRLAHAMNARLLEIGGNHALDECAPGELERLLDAIVEFVTYIAAQ